MNTRANDENFLDEDVIDQQDDSAADDIEQRARAQGWRPEEEWDEERAEREGRKKPAKFFTAKEFLERTANNLPMLNERIRRLEQENLKLTSSQREFSSLIDDQRKQHREALERVRENTRKEVEEKLERAAALGDMDAHKSALKEMKDVEAAERQALLDEAKAKPVEADGDGNAHAKQNPETNAWVERNVSWFRDPNRTYLNNYMVEQHRRIALAEPKLPVLDALEKAKRMVMVKFPEEFGGAPARRGSPGPDGNALGNNRGGSGQSVDERFNALPRDARDAYEKARVRMLNLRPPAKFTKEQYLADYGA
jgi:hypothetical protein